MTTHKEALKQLLEALDKELPHNMKHIAAGQRFNARTALAQQEQEPVAYIHRNEYNEYRLEPHDNFDIKSIPFNVDVSLFKSPQRTWVGLTDEDLAVCGDEDDVMLARYWERVCKEKNNA